MKEKVTQNDRLDYLLDAFKEDSKEYRNLKIPNDLEEKRVLLRSLMNIRMPGMMSQEVLSIQDEYLKKRNEEKGIVTLNDIPVIKNGISIWQGDITRLSVDAIVNAANSQMLGCFIPMHTCIDNCIHSFAGIQLRNECNEKMRQKKIVYGKDYEQPTSMPLMTKGYNLPAKNVIHVVGPIVSGTLSKENEKQLSQCYINTLDLCMEKGFKSVAFCCISTGVFHFPNKEAAKIAVNSVEDWLKIHPNVIERVIFNVFKDEDKIYYEQEF